MGAKSEEYIAKKRTKAARKRLRNTIDFTHGVQAARRRRKAGRRRVCEGMCYSLPTPEDPFNDLYEERLGKMKTKKKGKHSIHNFLDTVQNPSLKVDGNHGEKSKVETITKHKRSDDAGLPLASQSKKPSRLKSSEKICGKGNLVTWKPAFQRCKIRNGFWNPLGKGTFETVLCALANTNPLLSLENKGNESDFELSATSYEVTEWDQQLLEACGSGLDVLAVGRSFDENTVACCILTAVMHITARRTTGTSCMGPMALFIVQSKEHALEARKNCKLIKPLTGFHAVSLHAGTSLEHQIEGLRNILPDIVIATPDRLCDVLSVNAVSVSNVSFMLVNGLEEMVASGWGSKLEQIKSRVSNNVQTALLSRTIPGRVCNICRILLKDKIFRVESGVSLLNCSACIDQNVHVVVSEDKKMQKFLKLVNSEEQNRHAHEETLVFVQQPKALTQVKTALEKAGFSVECIPNKYTSKHDSAFRDGQVKVLLSMGDIKNEIDIASLRAVIFYEFPSTIDEYCKILTRMARHTAFGTLHSFCSGAMAPVASQLIDVLQQCLQPVPAALQMLAKAATAIRACSQTEN